MQISETRRMLTLASLVFAGEMIFSLPFHVARYFRPTLLQVFELDNATLGDIFAVYGITAMLACFPGGVLADRFSARGLMVIALLTTAVDGVLLSQIPDMRGLMWLFAFWGLTTILLFWAAMIKATRQWGGMLQQGFPAANLRVIDLSAPARDRFAGLGVGATEQWVDDPGQDQPPADVVVFAVKPQNMKAAVSGVKSQCAGALVVSIDPWQRCASRM